MLLPATLCLYLWKQRSKGVSLTQRAGNQNPRGRSHLDSSVPLPYFVPSSDLPAALPETAEIESSQEILTHRTGVKVVAVDHHFVIKYGKGVNLEEGRTMIFVKQRAQVPVPKIYALYHGDGKNFIVMERIHGRTLQDRWDTFTDLEKSSIATEIKSHLLKLRSITNINAYSSFDNQPLRADLFWTGHGENSLGCDGPFDMECDLNNAIIRKCRASEAMKGKANFYEDSLPEIFRGHPPVLTHGDLQRKNIIVRTDPKTGTDLVFIDWEVAGWYPSYWEYAQAMTACRLFDDDWHRYVDQFLKPFRNEYLWLYTLQNELW